MDRYRGIVELPLLTAKIDHLLGRLQSALVIGSYRTQEDLVRAYADIAEKIRRGVDTHVYDLPRPVTGTDLCGEELNSSLLGVYDEIVYLMAATTGTAGLVESNFNFAVAKIRDIQSGVKRIRQQLAVYSLYASNFGTARFIGDSFSSEDGIDRGSSFLKEKECFINLAEGTLMLPKKEEEDQWKIEKIEVGSNSNCILGNNTEAGTPVRGNIASMSDGNVDTWTEYERVVSAEDDEGLRLELKISLDDIRVVNNVRIHPVFLGARTPPVIRDIEVSTDGRAWTSLRGDIRVAEFMGEKVEDRFHLSPHSSRFAGEFNITFAPRFVKFIRVFIRQTSTFPIVDVYGARRLRYAVAIKEIVVYGSKFESKGEVISKLIDTGSNFTAASIISLVDPSDLPPEVGGAEYYLSFNDGASWQRLTSQDEASTEVPEVLFPEVDTSSLRWKVLLKKDELAFKDMSSRPVRNTREIHNFPARSPHSVKLVHKAKSGTISVCDPGLAGRGKLYPKMEIGRGVYSELRQDSSGDWERHGNAQLRLRVPVSFVKSPAQIVVYVNNTPISRISEWTVESRLAKKCIIQRATDGATEGESNEFEVVFGNDDPADPKGFIPSPTDVISVIFTREWVSVDGLAAPYTISLDHPSNGNKKDTVVTFYGTGAGDGVEEVLPNGVTIFKLNHKNIFIDDAHSPPTVLVISAKDQAGNSLGSVWSLVGDPHTITGSVAFTEYKLFVDGSSEIQGAGQWTLDPLEGYLYIRTPVDDDLEFTVSYKPSNGIQLEDSDWDFSPGKVDEITVYESGYHTVSSEVAVTSGVRSVVLPNSGGIVSKSVRLTENIFGAGIIPFEVPYINGVDEFEDRGKIQDEEVPQAVAAGAPPIAQFRVTQYQNLIATSGVTLLENGESSQIATNEVPNYGSLSSAGDYYFDTNGTGPDGIGYFYVVLATVGDTIPANTTISYHYRDVYSYTRMRGSYSVDGRNSRVFFSERTSTTGTVYYKYTPYNVKYIISRLYKEGEEWTLGPDGTTITMSGATDASHSGKLAIKYEYEIEESNTADLAPYFSPLLRGLAVKVA